MKFKWQHCPRYRGEINMWREDVDATLGWVAKLSSDEGYILYMRQADCPSEKAHTIYPTLLQAMRALRREYVTMLVAGEFNDD